MSSAQVMNNHVHAQDHVLQVVEMQGRFLQHTFYCGVGMALHLPHLHQGRLLTTSGGSFGAPSTSALAKFIPPIWL